MGDDQETRQVVDGMQEMVVQAAQLSREINELTERIVRRATAQPHPLRRHDDPRGEQ